MSDAFRRLLPYILRYKRAFLLGLGCVIVTTSVALLSPWVLKYAIDDLHRGVTAEKLRFYAGVLLLIAIIGGTFRLLMRKIIIGASRGIEYDLRDAFFSHLQRMPAAYFQAHRTGDLMSRATNDLNAVRMMIGPAVMYSANTIIVFIVALILMLSIDTRLALIALVPLPFVSISVKVFGSEIHKRFEQIQAQLSDLSAVVQETLSGVRVVRAYRQEEAEIERFRRANQEYVDRNRGLITLQGMFYPSMEFFLGLGGLLVLWLGSRDVISGRITLGEFVAFNSYLVMLSWPMIAFGWVTNMLQRGTASWKRMLEVLETLPAISDGDAASPFQAPSDIVGAIEFRDVVFTYGTAPSESERGLAVSSGKEVENRGQTVLDHVTISLEAGKTLALVGPTGSGKSTLIGLLPRLFDPPPGTVFIDGVDVRTIPLHVLRGAIGFVPQEPFLFSDTIAENIAFGARLSGSDHDDQRRIEAAAAIARLDKDVADFPKGYDTMVGERGITLSGGQKQRTALARAVMIDPRILILDDALSAVDTYTEEEILRGLRGVMRARTSIIVSHRVSTVRDADLIVVLEEGRVVERGTHDELIRRGGPYAELYKKQLLEEELAAS